MKTQQIQNTFKNVQRTTGSLWFWLGLGILLFVAAMTINDLARHTTIIPDTGSPFKAQSVPEEGVQSVTDYLRVHSVPSAQAVPEAAVQSVNDYIRLHSNELSTALITDPAAQSVMDYLKAHGIQP
jgi:hypothetical protein